MNFVVIGIDHGLLLSDCGFEAMMRGFLDQRHSEPLVAIGEEWDETKGLSICQRLAAEHRVRWYNPDLSIEEKRAMGILDEQVARRKLGGVFRVPSDEIREEAMANKLSQFEPGTTFVVCGYLHFESLVEKLRKKGNFVETRVYLRTLPNIKDLSSAELVLMGERDKIPSC